MKRILVVAMALMTLAGGAVAQTKVIEKSAKKVPAWLSSAAEDYLVVSVNAPSLDEAQNQAINKVTEQIISSVASNVSVSSMNVLYEDNNNGDIETKNKFAHMYKIRSAKLPFIKGISMAKVQDVYWRKMRNKETNEEFYEYAIKYPFSEDERLELVHEFERLDAENTAVYNAMAEKINAIDAVEEIAQCIAQLEPLKDFFFDDVRLNQTKSLIKRYEELYKSLSVNGTFLEPGTYQCQLLLEGNPVAVAKEPKVTSNCAGKIVVTPSEGNFLVTYDAVDCLPEEENFLNVMFQVNGRRLQRKAYFSEAGGAGANFSVVPEGKIYLTADSVVVADRKLYNINIRLSLNNRGGMPFGLKSIELEVPDLSAPIIFDDIDGVYKTRGILQVRALAEGEFTAREKKAAGLKMVSGAVNLVNPGTGAVERVRIQLPYATNWE